MRKPIRDRSRNVAALDIKQFNPSSKSLVEDMCAREMKARLQAQLWPANETFQRKFWKEKFEDGEQKFGPIEWLPGDGLEVNDTALAKLNNLTVKFRYRDVTVVGQIHTSGSHSPRKIRLKSLMLGLGWLVLTGQWKNTDYYAGRQSKALRKVTEPTERFEETEPHECFSMNLAGNDERRARKRNFGRESSAPAELGTSDWSTGGQPSSTQRLHADDFLENDSQLCRGQSPVSVLGYSD
ncbi:hypothetical protein K469DRAFT_746477 [Zopfia rhizophila CBS 207.26]|uniref:Uncharacterized protein n=1 Tax=Zopfia rhizophila CBS 207.26 TaxID=1314779 RepID=A0A6A6EJV6_9PEZI|nr:hypothetical protein K469DRAFT_746477 [Zopfia rhizophila CBS 207.26]